MVAGATGKAFSSRPPGVARPLEERRAVLGVPAGEGLHQVEPAALPLGLRVPYREHELRGTECAVASRSSPSLCPPPRPRQFPFPWSFGGGPPQFSKPVASLVIDMPCRCLITRINRLLSL